MNITNIFLQDYEWEYDIYLNNSLLVGRCLFCIYMFLSFLFICLILSKRINNRELILSVRNILGLFFKFIQAIYTTVLMLYITKIGSNIFPIMIE